MQAKFLVRWPSWPPLVLAPERDPELGADPRNNDFYYEEDPKGLKYPAGATSGAPTRATPSKTDHQREHPPYCARGFVYGPTLPEGRWKTTAWTGGLCSSGWERTLSRQFEFVKSQWHNDGNFAGLGDEKDLIAGANDGSGTFTIPQRPIRRRLHGVPRFVTTKGVSTASCPASGRYIGWLSSMHEVKASTTTPGRERW